MSEPKLSWTVQVCGECNTINMDMVDHCTYCDSEEFIDMKLIPLEELESLAIRTVSRLKTAYQIQITLTCVVAALLLFVVLWSIFMVTQNQLMYATAFSSSGIGMLVLSKWKWQPFERVAEARKLADDADILAAGLRLRIKSISEIVDPKERSQAQWEAVSEYLDRS